MRRIIATIFLGLFLVTLSSCNKEPKITPVTGITVNPTSLSLIEGESANLIATISPKAADNQTVIWLSSNGNVASVSDGKVTAIKAGESTITAKSDDGGYTATCSVTVTPATIEVVSISLSSNNLALIEGDSETLTATVSPEDATEKTVKWSSSDDSIVSVSNGKVTAKKAGTANILAQAGGKSASCSVTVSKRVIPVESISISSNHNRLKKGETCKTDVTVLPENANDYSIRFSSSNPNVATVSEDGTITGVASGRANITVEAGGKTTEMEITIFEKDDVYAITTQSNHGYTSKLWKDSEPIVSLTDYRLNDFHIINGELTILATFDNNVAYAKPYIIKGNDYIQFEDLDYSKHSFIGPSYYSDGKFYVLIEYRDENNERKVGLWKDKKKLYDIKYGPDGLDGLFVVGDDIYIYGGLFETTNGSRHWMPTVWKNGEIMKTFPIKEYGLNEGAEIVGMEAIRGEFYYLISSGSSEFHLSVFNDSGKLYDLCSDQKSANGRIKAYNGHLYAGVSSYNNSVTRKWTVFEDEKVLFSIPDGLYGTFDIIDGDIYSLVLQLRLWEGALPFYSESVFRNENKEWTLIDETVSPPTGLTPIKVFNAK